MKIVTQNPYRTIGLLADCTEKEMQRQKSLIKRFLDIGKEISFDTDIQLPTYCKRDSENISVAFAKIEQAKGRVTNGLFWFVRASHYDEPALSYLQDGDTAKAIELWQKLVLPSDETITSRNASAAHNLSTLKLGLAFSNIGINKSLLGEGLLLKAKLLNAEFVTDIIKKISDETFVVNKEEINKLFADELLSAISPFLDNTSGITSAEFISIFKQAPENLRAYVQKKFVDKPLHAIETLIEETQKQRKTSKTNAYDYGNSLFNKTRNNLHLLKSILGVSNLQYTLLADKIAGELLQCSTDYFNTLKNSDDDPGAKSLQLTRFGNSIACGSKIKEKIKEDIDFLEEWIADKPERDKYNKTKVDIEYIENKLQKFKNGEDLKDFQKARNFNIGTQKMELSNFEFTRDFDLTGNTALKEINYINQFLDLCKPSLHKIRVILGALNKDYINLSSFISSSALNRIVSHVNNIQENPPSDGLLDLGLEFDLFGGRRRKPYLNLRTALRESLDVIYRLKTFEMNSNDLSHLNDCLSTLKKIVGEMGMSSISPKERCKSELLECQKELQTIENKTFLESDITTAKNEMAVIKEWKFLRSKSERNKQISEQETKLNNLIQKSEQEKKSSVNYQQTKIANLKTKLQQLEY